MTNLKAVLISSRYDAIHDDAFARNQLSALLNRIEGLDLETVPDYGSSALDAVDLLVTYIAQRAPNEAECTAVRRFLDRGGRWFAIHTSNAVGESCPLPSALGSRFITHPPYGPFSVAVTKPDDVLLEGIEPFDVEDELYVIEAADDIDVLLHARWGGEGARGMQFEDAMRPLMYRRNVGAGEVLYLALGHCNPAGIVTRGEPVGERRGSWQSPVFLELVSRGIDWAARRR